MDRFGSQRKEVPEHISILQIRPRVALLSMNEIVKFQRITNEEYGGVVSRHIVVAFLGVELDSESTGVPLRVRREGNYWA